MSKPTLAIYGIKDRDSGEYPVFVHDHNLCVMQDGKILQYLQLERFSRRKYDNRLDQFIDGLIDDRIISLPEDFDIVCANDFTGNAFISQSGRLHFEANRAENLSPELIPAHAFLGNPKGCSGQELDAWCCSHELAHIFSCIPFYGHFKENSLLVSFDGASSLGNYSAFLYRDGRISHIENNWNDLGFASKFFNDNKLSFRTLNAVPYEHCSVPGKLMGFASLGQYRHEIEEWLQSNNFFNELHKFHSADILNSIQKHFGNTCNEFDTHNKFLQDCAATLQHIFNEAILNKLHTLQEKYRCDCLYYSGGCALNIVANTKIIESGLFKDVFIAPCCNDSGLSIGAATFLEMKKGNSIKPHDPYLCNVGLTTTQYKIDYSSIEAVADLIMKQGVVGICNGPAEIGPRALGNRSLIALANSKALAAKISMDVKRREWYRPVAPIMLKTNAELVTNQKVSSLARYMLQDFIIKEEYRPQMAGVVHTNNSARIQTIANEAENPFMFHLLTLLQKKYGIIALINTSFNAQGEPIVHTAEQALQSARKMNLDGIVINGKLEVLK